MKQKLALLGLSGVTLVLLLTVTDPSKVPSFVLIIPFVLLFVVLFLFMLVLSTKKDWSRAKTIRRSVVLAGLPTTFLIMQSVGQLTIRDVISILAIFIIAYFYVSRAVVTN